MAEDGAQPLNEEGEPPRRGFGRRVFYGSPSTRIVRLMTGLALGAITAWLVVPALATEHGPPPPIFLDLEADTATSALRPDGSTGVGSEHLLLNVYAGGCTNPVEVQGTFSLPDSVWSGRFPRAGLPRHSEITLVGARVHSVSMSFSPAVPVDTAPAPTRLAPSAVIGRTMPDGTLADSVVAGFQDWPRGEELQFTMYADLVDASGFRSCYVSVPTLFDNLTNPGGTLMPDALSSAVAFASPGRLYGLADLGSAVVGVSVGSLGVAPATLGDGGTASADGVIYYCHQGSAIGGPIAGLLPATPEAPGCGAAPLFQPADLNSDVLRRIFAGGIVGALAATLVVESLFVAETEGGRGRRFLVRRFRGKRSHASDGS